MLSSAASHQQRALATESDRRGLSRFAQHHLAYCLSEEGSLGEAMGVYAELLKGLRDESNRVLNQQDDLEQARDLLHSNRGYG
jgi:hypothetical protein